MLTYQDLLQAQAESRLLAFLTTAMQAHESSPEKHIAQIGSDYMRQQNTTITNARLYTTLTGKLSLTHTAQTISVQAIFTKPT